MRLLNDIFSFLNHVREPNITLFFIIREKSNGPQRYCYSPYSTTISDGIGDELFQSAKSQIYAILSREPEFIEHGILSASDRYTIDFISAADVPYLTDLLLQLAQSDLDTISDDNYSSVLGYIVKIENQGNTLYLVKKSTPTKLLHKGRILAMVRDGSFSEVNANILTIEGSYDAAFLQPDVTAEVLSPTSNQVFIFNRPNFEAFFDYKEHYMHAISVHQSKLDGIEFICNLQGVVEYCSQHGLMIRKLARILAYRSFDPSIYSRERISEQLHRYNVELQMDADGSVAFCQSNMWIVLRLLDDDYLTSGLTGENYEARSKLKLLNR
jgi:hypothetical protein